MNKQQCSECLFYEHLKNVEGSCHRFPPNLSQGKYVVGQGDMWPIVPIYEWCGEFKQRTSKMENQNTESQTICPCCENPMDTDVCWCGEEIRNHKSEHSPIPLGCTCGFTHKPKK